MCVDAECPVVLRNPVLGHDARLLRHDSARRQAPGAPVARCLVQALTYSVVYMGNLKSSDEPWRADCANVEEVLIAARVSRSLSQAVGASQLGTSFEIQAVCGACQDRTGIPTGGSARSGTGPERGVHMPM